MGSFWVLSGASWEPFWWSWGLLGSSRWLPSFFQNDSGALFGFSLASSLSFFLIPLPLIASKWFWIFFWDLYVIIFVLLGRILSPKTDLPSFDDLVLSYSSPLFSLFSSLYGSTGERVHGSTSSRVDGSTGHEIGLGGRFGGAAPVR